MSIGRNVMAPSVVAAVSIFAASFFDGAARSQEKADSAPHVLGFTPESARAQTALEGQFLAIPSPERARQWHRYFTAEPHPAASARNNELAEYIAAEWRKQGWENVGGIPGRPWFEHLLYAARYTYAHLELPGLTEAAERRDWKTAREQALLLQDAIRRNTELLRAARVEWEERK